MKDLSIRKVLVNVMGIVMARAVFGNMGLVGISFFNAIYMEGRGRFLMLIMVFLGFLSKLTVVNSLKYVMAMLVVSIIGSLIEHYNKRLSLVTFAILSSLVVVIFNITDGLLNVSNPYSYIVAVLEGVAIFALTIIFKKGIEPFIHGMKGQALNNEQVISLFVILAFFLYGIPSFEQYGFSLHSTIAYFLVIFMGYKYGAGYGALAGAASGVILALQSGHINEIGLMCMLGIISGTFREFGRIFTLFIYCAGAIILGELFKDNQVDIANLSALASSGFLFMLLPKSIVNKEEPQVVEENDEIFVRQTIQNVARSKLRDFSESFLNLSQTFNSISDKKSTLTKQDKNEIFNELSEQLCKNCSNCNVCWKSNYYDTFQGATKILEIVEQNGTISLNEIPESFANRCISLEYYIGEARRIVEIAKINLFWHNRMAESREVIAGQLSEVANIIDDFSLDLYKTVKIPDYKKREMIAKLRANHIVVSKIAIFEKRNDKQEIFLTLRMEKGKCITTKEAAQVLSDIVGKRLRPDDSCKNVISREFENFTFVEDTNYKVLTAMARITKEEGRVSGDNYSFIYPTPGTVVMTLSDGMGTGSEACRESESVVELLERFIEAGFKKESAIKLINSILVLKSEEQTFSTIDMSVINLYTGLCDFIKVGASSTFIKKRSGVEVINSTSLPAGIIDNMEYETISRWLEDGDFVMMVTDGVVDCIKGEDKELYLCEYIDSLDYKNSRDMANAILNHALELNDGIPKDDMTVLVSGFWKK